MTEMTYEEGKIYLRNINTGQIYLYERHLAANKSFEAVVPNPVAEPQESGEGEQQ